MVVFSFKHYFLGFFGPRPLLFLLLLELDSELSLLELDSDELDDDSSGEASTDELDDSELLPELLEELLELDDSSGEASTDELDDDSSGEASTDELDDGSSGEAVLKTIISSTKILNSTLPL
jgi:hypothetical protein